MSGASPGFDLQSAFIRVHEKLDRLSQDLAHMKAHVEGLIGNGQPGRISVIEADVDDLKTAKAGMKGYLAGLGAALTLLGAALHFMVDMIRGK